MKQGAQLLLVIQAVINTYSFPHVPTPWAAPTSGDQSINHQSFNHQSPNHKKDAIAPNASLESLENRELPLYRVPRPQNGRSDPLGQGRSQAVRDDPLEQGDPLVQGGSQAGQGDPLGQSVNTILQKTDVRSRRSTSKVTGLVVGASADAALRVKVKDKLNDIEASLWNLQSQITKPFGPQDQAPGTVLGTFPSYVRTNFHGGPPASGLRQSQGVMDTNSLSTLLVLHCLTETVVNGGSKIKSAANVSIAVQALESYHSRTYDRGSSILTLWQEKVLAGAQNWVNFPENVVRTKVKDSTTYNQLQTLAKSCDCELVKTGLKEMSENKLCQEYFNTPFSDVIYDSATPPDFMTSFLNLALGGLLAINTPANIGEFKTESKLWTTVNNDVSRLVAKLKELVIVYPAVRSKSDLRSPQNTAASSTVAEHNTVAEQNTAAEHNTSAVHTSAAMPTALNKSDAAVGSQISSILAMVSNISSIVWTSPGPVTPTTSSTDLVTPTISSTDLVTTTISSTGPFTPTISSTDLVTPTISSTGPVTPAVSSTGPVISAITSTGPVTTTTSNIGLVTLTTSNTGSLEQTGSHIRSNEHISSDRRSIESAESTHKESTNHSSRGGDNVDQPQADVRPDDCTSCNVSVRSVQRRDRSDITSADVGVTSLSTNVLQTSTLQHQSSETTIASTTGQSETTIASTAGQPETTIASTTGQPETAIASTAGQPETTTGQPETSTAPRSTTTSSNMTSSVRPTSASIVAPKHATITSSKTTSTAAVTTSIPSGSPQATSAPYKAISSHGSTTPPTEADTGNTATTPGTPILDSVSYFGLRHYLDDVINKDGDIALIPLWISDDADASRNVTAPGAVHHNGQLYHEYNSVDLTTTATVLHALVTAAMAGLVDVSSDDQLQNIVTSSLRMLTWYITHPSDLTTFVTLSSFPSKSMLYWSVARVAFQLSSDKAKSFFNFTGDVMSSFLTSLRKDMTYDILQSIVDGGLGQDGVTRVYIDQFIGAADMDGKGAKKASGDDRLFTSAMGVNSLLATWTVQGKEGSLKFIESTDDSVKIAVNGLVNYVISALGDSTTAHENAYLSERVKNCQTLPSWFPSNVITSRDGKSINVNTPDNTLRYGVRGHIPKDVYEQELAKPRFNRKPEVSADALNGPTSVFRFWTSPGLTKSACMLAIAQAANLLVDGAG